MEKSKYEGLNLKGIPLLTLIETKILTKRFWIDHGAVYPRIPKQGERKCSCGFVGNTGKYFMGMKFGLKTIVDRCKDCRVKISDKREHNYLLRKKRGAEAPQ